MEKTAFHMTCAKCGFNPMTFKAQIGLATSLAANLYQCPQCANIVVKSVLEPGEADARLP